MGGVRLGKTGKETGRAILGGYFPGKIGKRFGVILRFFSGKIGKRHGFLRGVTVNRSGKTGKRFQRNKFSGKIGKRFQRKIFFGKNRGVFQIEILNN